MRILILLLLSNVVYSQRLIRTPYEVRMESIAISRLNLNLDTLMSKEKVLVWNPIQRLKITFKTRLNNNVISKLDFTNDVNDVNDVFDELDSDDYWSLGAYDIRGKYYLNKICRITGRMMITGIETQTYFYSIGLVLKY